LHAHALFDPLYQIQLVSASLQKIGVMINRVFGISGSLGSISNHIKEIGLLMGDVEKNP